jgi:hypothetical protein
MGLQDNLPEPVINLLKSANYAEFASVSAAGVPIDTPLLSFPEEDLGKIGMATGLAYPVKAERVRRNPKVGLLYEGILPGEPALISIAGMAATRDSDIQANVVKYVAETGMFGAPDVPWETKRKAVWYWARILIDIIPKQILWWDSAAHLDKPPHRWDAPAGTVYPTSDRAPAGKASAAPKWNHPPWQQLAKEVLGRNTTGHLSSIDADGFPRPMRTTSLSGAEDGFLLTVPDHAPGARRGPASLTFFGRETFIGSLERAGRSGLKLVVERALPILPIMADPNETWNPKPDTLAGLFGRLKEELGRRHQPIPSVPEVLAPTPGALRRAARETAMARSSLDRIVSASDKTE